MIMDTITCVDRGGIGLAVGGIGFIKKKAYHNACLWTLGVTFPASVWLLGMSRDAGVGGINWLLAVYMNSSEFLPGMCNFPVICGHASQPCQKINTSSCIYPGTYILATNTNQIKLHMYALEHPRAHPEVACCC